MKFLTRRTTGVVAAIFVLAYGCGDTDGLGPESEPDPAESTEPDDAEDEVGEPDSESTETEEEPEPSEESDLADDVDLEEGAEDGWQYLEEFDEPFVAEDSGVRLSVTGMGLNDVTTGDVDDEILDFLEDGTQTLVVLEMTASNDSGSVIDFYPDQGTIQFGREQVEADLWFSESLAGFDWRDGVDDSGQVLWQLETPYDEALSVGELTLVVNAAYDSETFDDVTDTMELQVTWTGP